MFRRGSRAGDVSGWLILAGWERDLAASQAYLCGTAEVLRRKGFAVTTDVVIGESISEQITNYAGREKSDLIAIATHGRGGLSRMLRGSVADAVTRTARACVLVFHTHGAAVRAAVLVHDGAFTGRTQWPVTARYPRTGPG
mgnify:CR=1 FL=1